MLSLYPKECLECGSDPANHLVEYVGLYFDRFALPLMALPSALARFLLPPNKKRPSVAPLYELLARLSLGHYLDAPDEHTMLLNKVLWEEAAKRGMRMREFRLFGLPKQLFVVELPGGSVFDFEGVPLPYKKETVWWIDNKSILKKELLKQGVPTARGGVVSNSKEALALFNGLAHPVIVKPSVGSASRHTTLHIASESELTRAFSVAKQIAPQVIVEEELRGAVYRPTVVGGKVVATLRRDQPHVVGDGNRTVAELVEEANKHPARQGPYFSHLTVTPAALAELAYQGLALDSVPAPGRRVLLHQKINWSLGGTTADVTDEVHPDNKALFEKIAALLKAPLVGIDFIIEDIRRPWHEQQRCGVIECNSMPYFDNHHLPFEGQPRDVAGPIWDLYFSGQ